MIAGTSAVGFFISWFIEEMSLEREELVWQQFETDRREQSEKRDQMP